MSEDAQVNCHFVFHYLVSVNEFIEFMNVLFQSQQNYVIDDSDKTYRFRYKAVTQLTTSEEEEEDSLIC